MHLGIPVHLPLGVHVLHMDLNVFQNTYVAEGTLLHCTVLLHLYIYIFGSMGHLPSTTTSNNQIANNHHDVCIKMDHAARIIVLLSK